MEARTERTAERRPLVCIADYQAAAEQLWNRNARDYYASGAEDEITLRSNVEAFRRRVIVPRCLVNVSTVSTVVALGVGGQKASMPVLVAPTAFHRMAHRDGECATARACARCDTIYTHSSLATTSLAETATATSAIGTGARWFQLYVTRNRSEVVRVVREAERTGYTALVLTVDTPILGRRENDIRRRFRLPEGLQLGVLSGDEVEQTAYCSNTSRGGSGLANFVSSRIDASLTWSDFEWLRELTHLPVLVKGVLHPDDAEQAVRCGAAGIIVSNHGARQLDTAPATLDVLEEITAAVHGRVPVFIDGGIRRGTDVIKALALGARAVFIGRPVLYGLTVAGEEGVVRILEMFRHELETAMRLCGVRSVEEISQVRVRPCGARL